jgi:hypothetical protein
MSRQDQYAITVSIDGLDSGVWDKKTGGETDSEETKYRPGGMAEAVSLGGSRMVGNVTLQRLYTISRDHAGGWNKGSGPGLDIVVLRQRVGRATVVIKEQPLDINGAAFGIAPVTYHGTLKRVSTPDVDSESNDAGLIEIEVTIAGDAK